MIPKVNIAIGYISQAFSILSSIVVVPIYITHMGLEVYGLISFFAMTQVWMQLLDMGLASTLSRESSKFKAGITSLAFLTSLLTSFEKILLLAGGAGAVLLIIFSGYIARDWLNASTLSHFVLQESIILMAASMSLRWAAGIYRGALAGLEQQLWIGYSSILLTFLRYFLIIPYIIYVSISPVDFFAYQLVISAIECWVLRARVKSFIGRNIAGIMPKSTGELISLKGVLGFSASLGLTNAIWVMVTQSDKLLLSKILSLEDFAFFSIAVMMANVIYPLYTPLTNAILPRLTKYAAEDNTEQFKLLYRKSTQFICAVIIPIGFILSFFPYEIIFLWTKDSSLANASAISLRCYALGNMIVAFGAFTNYLQMAYGNMRLHVIGSLLYLMILFPALVVLTKYYGINGAGYSWLMVNSLYFVIWIPVIHSRFLRSFHLSWLFRDILPIMGVDLFIISTLKYFDPFGDSRIENLFFLALILCILTTASLASTKFLRYSVTGCIRKIFYVQKF
ncbi:oligosaccharide flippase family protein [Polynucleobacter paneuropaeus]|nr:oligosaccharide flippase family protein [Polynucleobacter paneuropaeus]